MSTEDRNRAWVEVRGSAVVANYRRIAEAAGTGAGVVPMVKADGYGVGAGAMCRLLSPLAPAAYGVAAVSAGAALRDLGVTERIIVFTAPAPGEEAGAAAAGLEVVAGDADGIRRASVAGLPYHLELDTGMGRAGWPVQAADPDLSELRGLLAEHAGLRGVFTHLHSADEAGAPGVQKQLERFDRVLTDLAPPPGTEIHVANSAGVLLVELGESVNRLARKLGATVLVRPGIHLYGGGAGPDLPGADPVVSLRARIVRIAEVPAGSTLGYGADYRAAAPERWATLAIGYGDGVRRSLSPGGRVLIGGHRVPVIGRISMDMTVANISGLDGVRTGDVATLIGRDGDHEITIDEMAQMTGTISWEVLTSLTSRLPRVWERGE